MGLLGIVQQQEGKWSYFLATLNIFGSLGNKLSGKEKLASAFTDWWHPSLETCAEIPDAFLTFQQEPS